jgi:glycosyltransferase involved in cell wall biosynthesis
VARALLHRADVVLTTCRAMAAEVRGAWRVDASRVATISWGVDRTFLTGGVRRADVLGDRGRWGFAESDVVLLAPRGAGRVYRTAEVVRAFAAARADRPELRLVLTGISSAADRRTAGLGAVDPPGVTALPLQSPDVLAQLYRAADLVVSVPVGDQRSSSVLEAIASGARLLVSDLPAYREIAADGAQLTVLPGDLTVDRLTGAFAVATRRDDDLAAAHRAWARAHEQRAARFAEIASRCLQEVPA